MQLAPRYDGPVVVTIDDEPGNQLAPFESQRRRLEALLAGLAPEAWASGTRCEGWTVKDVVAHLVSVNQFWHLSVTSGLAGSPTRYLSRFDPAATPAQIVASMDELAAAEVLDQFVTTNATLIDTLSSISGDGWMTLCETPAGHVPIQILTQHGLWDAWIHERDIALPLGLPTPLDVAEITSVLRFAAAIGPVLGLGLGRGDATLATVAATAPDIGFAVVVSDHVTVRALDGDWPDDGPCLRGDAVDLTEALSLRTPLPDDAPDEWRRLLGSLEVAFTLPGDG